MAGAACAKVIIDQGYALQRATSCLSATLLLRAPDAYPTEEQEQEFVSAANHVAEVAAKIQAAVAGNALGSTPPHPGHLGS